MPTYGEFEVSLNHIEPRIWRRFQIAATVTFADLHRAIQDSFGWEDSHLWEFRMPGRRGRVLAGVGDDSFGGLDAEEVPDARSVKLSQHFKAEGELKSCEYVYDFGDSWSHDVKLTQRVSVSKRFLRRLLDGERACPPEDCGGVGGYARLLQFVETGEDPYVDDPAELADSLGDWQPDAFDLGAAKNDFDE